VGPARPTAANGRIRSSVVGVVAGLIVAGVVAQGQSTARVVTVHGIAYDSLHGAPLEGAFITLGGSPRTATSDARGRFSFDVAVPGTYSFTMLHDVLDSVGLSGATTRTTFRDGSETVRLSVPSFAALWRVACGESNAPRDSGFVFGTIRDAQNRTPLAGATIAVRWVELSFDLSAGVTEHRASGEVRSNSAGAYALCGVPIDAAFRLLATRDSGGTALLDIQPSDEQVRRRDLSLASSATLVGTINGQVRDALGQPMSRVRVVTDGAVAVLTGEDGRFTIANVPAGTRQIGVPGGVKVPAVGVVEVAVHDTVAVSFVVDRITAADPVAVRAQLIRKGIINEIDQRRRQGIGRVMDSTTIMQFASPQQAILSVAEPGKVCALYIDGVNEGRNMAEAWKEFRFRRLADIAVMEVHQGKAIPAGYIGRCGDSLLGTVVLVWLKSRDERRND